MYLKSKFNSDYRLNDFREGTVLDDYRIELNVEAWWTDWFSAYRKNPEKALQLLDTAIEEKITVEDIRKVNL